MAERVGWGILGTGKIAVKFADDLRHVPGAALTAVGSRSAEAAEAFGRRFGIPHRHASYAALVNDPDVDLVYVSTPSRPARRECPSGARGRARPCCARSPSR